MCLCVCVFLNLMNLFYVIVENLWSGSYFQMPKTLYKVGRWYQSFG